MHTRATCLALWVATLEPFNTHPAEGDEARNFWTLLRQGGNTHSRALIADFLGVATGVAARRLRLTHERMGPIWARRRDRKETVRELAAHATDDVTDYPRCTWLTLKTSPLSKGRAPNPAPRALASAGGPPDALADGVRGLAIDNIVRRRNGSTNTRAAADR